MTDWYSVVGDREYEEAKEVLFKYLKSREHSERESRDYLVKKGYSEEVVEVVIERAKELDYLNDRRFAELWVKNRANSRQKGAEFLKKELLQKGISGDLIENIIMAEYNSEQELAAALQVARKKLKSYLNKPNTWKGRLWRFLAQRGFAEEIIADVLNQLREEEIQN